MKVTLLDIHISDDRSLSEIPAGETVVDQVELDVDGRNMTFSFFTEANILADIGGSMVVPDDRLEALLRFDTATHAQLCQLVAAARARNPPTLPLLLLDTEETTITSTAA